MRFIDLYQIQASQILLNRLMNLFAFKNLAKNLDLKEDTYNYQVNLMESENSEDLVFKISLSQEGTIK